MRNGVVAKNGHDGVIDGTLRRDGVIGVIAQKLRRECVVGQELRRDGVIWTSPGGASYFVMESFSDHFLTSPKNV